MQDASDKLVTNSLETFEPEASDKQILNINAVLLKKLICYFIIQHALYIIYIFFFFFF